MRLEAITKNAADTGCASDEGSEVLAALLEHRLSNEAAMHDSAGRQIARRKHEHPMERLRQRLDPEAISASSRVPPRFRR